jgi:hypothetical protein
MCVDRFNYSLIIIVTSERLPNPFSEFYHKLMMVLLKLYQYPYRIQFTMFEYDPDRHYPRETECRDIICFQGKDQHTKLDTMNAKFGIDGQWRQVMPPFQGLGSR